MKNYKLQALLYLTLTFSNGLLLVYFKIRQFDLMIFLFLSIAIFLINVALGSIIGYFYKPLSAVQKDNSQLDEWILDEQMTSSIHGQEAALKLIQNYMTRIKIICLVSFILLLLTLIF